MNAGERRKESNSCQTFVSLHFKPSPQSSHIVINCLIILSFLSQAFSIPWQPIIISKLLANNRKHFFNTSKNRGKTFFDLKRWVRTVGFPNYSSLRGCIIEIKCNSDQISNIVCKTASTLKPRTTLIWPKECEKYKRLLLVIRRLFFTTIIHISFYFRGFYASQRWHF